MPLLTDLQTMLPHLVGTIGRIQMSERIPLDYDPASRNGSEPVLEGTGSPTAKREAIQESALNVERVTPGPPPATKRDGRGAAEASPRSNPTVENGSGASSRIDKKRGVEVIAAPASILGPPGLEIDPALTADWLITFLRDEFRLRGFAKGIVGISGGVDSAVTAFLAARALGASNVIGIRLPYRTSSPESLEHGQLIIDTLGMESRTVDISAAVDGYLTNEPDAGPTRRGNVMARMRMIALFDMAARYAALPVGTGNKTERLLGYFTWHADDSPPINPLGDLFKTQVWALAKHLGVPDVIVSKPASADLMEGQTDEGDFGISYPRADEILNWLVNGYGPSDLESQGFGATEIELVRRRLAGTHWKRKLPTVAMLSHSAIGESYLRPVDY